MTKKNTQIIEGEMVETKPKKKSKALANTKAIDQSSAEMLISRAIDKNVSVETMERLLKMRRELKAEFAKEEFDKAMANFQAECPAIKKSKQVLNKDKRTVRYRFAPLDEIVKQVKDRLKSNGFSYTTDTDVKEEWVTVICKVTHSLGHSDTSKFKIPIDKEAYMSHAQKFASALTFAKRYAFCNAFGILTGDEDDDAVETDVVKKPKASTPADIKQTIKDAVARAKKSGDVISLDQKTQESKKFDAKFKKEIHALANKKVEELDNGKK